MSFENNMKKQKKDARDALIPVNVVADTKEEVVIEAPQEATEGFVQAELLSEDTLLEDLTMKSVKNNFISRYEEKAKKLTVEDTHTRSTFLFRNDLQKRLDKLAKGKRGFKTDFLNTAIEALLDEMEK